MQLTLSEEKEPNKDLLVDLQKKQEDSSKSPQTSNTELIERMRELEALNTEILNGRLAALNIMEDAISSKEALRRSEENYRTLFQTMDEGFCSCELVRNKDGKVNNFRLIELNSAFERLFGVSYTEANGRLATELFPDLNEDLLQIYDRVNNSGQSERFENYVLSSNRWYDIRIFPTGKEHLSILYDDISERKQREANRAFLAELDMEFSRLTTPEEIMRVTGEKLGLYLDVAQCGFSDFDVANDRINLFYSWSAQEMPDFTGVYRLSEFIEPARLEILERGETVVVDNVLTDPRLSPQTVAAVTAFNLFSYVEVPSLQRGELKYALSVDANHPRQWRDDEITLINEVTSRLFPRMERARAEKALRKSEEKYRTLFNSIDEGFTIIELICDEKGQALDYRFLEVNQVYERQTGLKDVVGKLGSEVTPNVEPYWLEYYSRVVRTGEPSRFDDFNQDTGRWYSTYASRVGGPESRQVAIVFADITERKLTQERQEFLLKLSDVLRPLTDTTQIQATACRLVGDHLKVDRCYYSEVNLAEGWTRVEWDYTRGEAASIVGTYPLAAFSWTLENLEKGEILVLSDLNELSFLSRDEREAMEAIHSQAMVCVPLNQAGVWVACFAVTQTPPRQWKTYEIELIRETGERIWTTIERARTEKALRESEQNFRIVANIVPDLLWSSEPEGTNYWYNDRWFDYTGQSRTEANAWGWVETIHPEDREESARRYREALEKGRSLQQEHRIRRVDGEYRWFLVRAKPLLDVQGQVVRMYGEATDIHEQHLTREDLGRMVEKRTEELASSNAQLAAVNEQLKKERERLYNLSVRLLEVQETERRTLARELHDEIGQYLTGLKFMLESSKHLTPEGQKATISDTLATVDELMTRVRELSLNLRPTLLDDMGLIPALATHFQRFTTQTRIEVKFIHRGLNIRLAPEIETTVYRVVQEALTNVARHARTSKVLVQVVVTDQLILLIQDEGQGFSVGTKLDIYQSTGLSAMRERVELVGGSFTIESEINYGTTIIAQIPISLERGEEEFESEG
ncbi:MAG: hypothetical protein BGO39_06415 [Chloroflexi bacterium 54-19]|nr:MAG: hypothetical protein BGO39_06415 [Chloroflexi bacterium 54-19]